MNQQLELFDFAAPRPPKYTLFIGIFPDRYQAGHAASLASTHRRKNGMNGPARPIGHLHVTLLPIGHFPDIPETAAEAIGHVCQPVTASTHPFEISFDRIQSFDTRPGNYPVVLASDKRSNQGVRKLRRFLCAEFAKYTPSRRPPTAFTPHLTLRYDQQELLPQPIEPVSWLVKEIVLIASEVGATKYHPLAQWPLGASEPKSSRFHESQRDSIIQPRVARPELLCRRPAL